MNKTLLILLYSLPFAYLLYIIAVYFRTRVPYVVTPKKYFPIIFQNIKITPETVVFDLGCGKGDFLFACEKFKPKKLVGYELSPLHALYAKVKARLKRSRVEIFCKDFYTADISQADIIYLFLVPKIVNSVWQKIKKQAKMGALVLTLADAIEGETPIKIFKLNPQKEKSSKMFVYQIV